MAFELDRIDGRPALLELRPENVLVRDDEATIELRLSADHDVELYFPAPDGVIEPKWFALAADVLVHLTAIDNEVQRVCAAQWAGTPYPSSHSEGELAYIILSGPVDVTLGYFVIGCNSNWDERFIHRGGRWVRVEPAKPATAEDP